MHLLSIVVPVYNVENFLRSCLSSILSSSFKDFELLLVDDGSLDNSGKICDEYALKDSRVLVYHRQNSGVSSARNYGLRMASGEWVTFIDSDDFISTTFLEGLLSPVIKGERIDFVQGGCVSWLNNHVEGITQSYEYYVGDNPGYLFNHFRGLVVSKLFRLSKIKKNEEELYVSFNESMVIAEDMVFTLDYICEVNKYAFVSEIGYYYRKDNVNSATRRIGKESYDHNYRSAVVAYRSVLHYISCKQLSYSDSLFRLRQRGGFFFYTLLSLYKSEWRRSERLRRIREDFTDEYLGIIALAKTSFPQCILRLLIINKQYIIFDIFASLAFTIKRIYENTLKS